MEEIKAVGESFDPEKHNAVMHIEDEEHGEGEIVEVFQKGYKKGNKMIRFAMVKTGDRKERDIFDMNQNRREFLTGAAWMGAAAMAANQARPVSPIKITSSWKLWSNATITGANCSC